MAVDRKTHNHTHRRRLLVNGLVVVDRPVAEGKRAVSVALQCVTKTDYTVVVSCSIAVDVRSSLDLSYESDWSSTQQCLWSVCP